jgi:hypothetical protein
MKHNSLYPKKGKPRDPTMKDNFTSLWANTRSMVYAGLTLGGILIVLMGSVILLPLLIILVVGVVIFIAYRLIIDESENT